MAPRNATNSEPKFIRNEFVELVKVSLNRNEKAHILKTCRSRLLALLIIYLGGLDLFNLWTKQQL